MKRFLVVVLVFSAMLSAAFVDAGTAKIAAENYYRNYAPSADKSNSVNSIISHEYEGQITWYGVNFEKGFVIINAEDALRPILGYSFEGQLPEETRPGGLAFKEWFGYYDKQIKVARENDYIDKEAQTDWKNIKNNIFPSVSKGVMVDALVNSRWDQVYPWNDLCPEKDGTWTYVGCVATAASMIMKYHEWPPTGTGSNTNSSAGTTETYSNYTFDYTVMEDVVEMEWGLYPSYWETINMDAAAIQTLAELNYLTGHSFDMSYGTTADGGSGANMSVASSALQTHWFYNTTYTSMSTPTDPTTSSAAIQSELDAGRPWWWAGGVHSFILDGYTDDYWYHFNWGWAGYCDGWYQITALIPADTGSGGGDGDYTTNQIRISCVPNTDPFTTWPRPTNVNGSVANDEDITVTWNAPSGGSTLTGYEVFKATNGGDAEMIASLSTGTTTYQDLNQIAGTYSYYIVAVYNDGRSHNSSAYRADIVPSANFPVIRSLAGEAVGRTNVDLTWLSPFTGVINYSTGFEDGIIPSDWVQKTSTKTNGDVKNDPKPPSTDWWAEDELDEIRLLDATTASHIVTRGEYACIFSTGATTNLWLFSPEITFNSDSFIKFWTRFRYGGTLGTENVRFSIVAYQGAFDEGRDCVYDVIDTFDSSVDPENNWESEWSVSLAAIAGQTKRVGFCVPVNANDYYTFAIDDILIGSTSGGVADDPTGFEVYRNDVLATTLSDPNAVSWTDTNFADGDNEYFIRSIYPTGQSIPSAKVNVNMDSNPKPDYLEGILNGTDIELAWYMPYAIPSSWFTLIEPENCTTTVDYLDDGTTITNCYKRRAEFKAEDVGLYYPVTIDSIAGGFFEWDDDLWGTDDTFVIRLWDGHPYDGTGTMLWQSGTLTAVPGEIMSVALDQPYVLNGEWNVEVETLEGTKGHPSTLAGPTSSGINCYFFNVDEDSYNYYISSGGVPLSYCLMAHCTGSDPTDTFKSGWASNEEIYDSKPVLDDSGRFITEGNVSSSKAINSYNVYRDGGVVGSTSTLTYTDAPSAEGTYEYYIKAVYTNPAGESEASNSINVYTPGTGGGPIIPAVPANVVTSIVGTDLQIDWDVSADATGYDVYASDDPYGTFTNVGSVGTNQYTIAADQAKMFYQIIATNSTKAAPKTIKVVKSVQDK